MLMYFKNNLVFRYRKQHLSTEDKCSFQIKSLYLFMIIIKSNEFHRKFHLFKIEMI